MSTIKRATLPDASQMIAAAVKACEAEPIHIPGAIQPHGLLLLFDASSEELAQWAGDFGCLLGATPEAGRSASELLGVSLADLIGSRSLRPGQEAVHAGRIQLPGKRPWSAVVHRAGRFTAVELEPVGTTRSGIKLLEQVRQITESIACSSSIEHASECAAEHVHSITGYDHVMVYRLLDDDGGIVVAEARVPKVTAYLNHRFPASDIPRQARMLYRRNLLRVIPEVGYTAVPIEPTDREQVDMSFSVLRSVSPAHISYLRNMDVGASMSASIIVDEKLWGLIASHHSEARLVPVDAQLLCRHVATQLSAFILGSGHAARAQTIAAQQIELEDCLQELRMSEDPERALKASAERLGRLVDCGGVAVMEKGDLVAGTGRLPGREKLRELASVVELRLSDLPSFSTDRLSEAIADAPPISADASGVLAISIEGPRPLLAVWVRPEQIEEVCWAGDPRVDIAQDKLAEPLTPRRSFASWRETVRGRSREWTAQDLVTVGLLKSRVELALQRHELTRLNQELELVNTHLNELATTDPLTSLANRRLFNQQMQAEWLRATRNGTPLALVAFDIDNFKKYNDHFGHPAGDECLKAVATAIDGARRETDVTARVGGEEFMLLLPETDCKNAYRAAERIRKLVVGLARDHPLNEGGLVTISAGVAAGTVQQWTEPTRLFEAVDKALYEAKGNGRNRVATFVPVMSDKQGRITIVERDA
jgi:chemotaxis family two-component system sensor kinase Cph1